MERIQTVAAYLSDHYAGEVPIERLAQIACMGTTKLKSSFKKVYGCTITEYIQQRRMSQAEYLLAHTDLQIGQIAQTIGYSTSSRFAELFRRSTACSRWSTGKWQYFCNNYALNPILAVSTITNLKIILFSAVPEFPKLLRNCLSIRICLKNIICFMF